MPVPGEVTVLLQRAGRGDRSAADELYRLVEKDLRAIAGKRKKRFENPLEGSKIAEVVPADDVLVIQGDLVETKDPKMMFEGKYLTRHPVHLLASRPYVIELTSTAFEPQLILGGIAKNNGIVPENMHFCRIDYTPPKTGEFIVGLTSRQPGQVGKYAVTLKGYRPPQEK